MGGSLSSALRKATVALAGLLILAGCWDRQEVNDLALVMATAIDQGEDGRILLSVQIFVPKASGGNKGIGEAGGSAGGSDQGQTLVKSAEGATMADAVAQLQRQLSRKLFWGHDEVYIFGKERAESGIAEDLDFLFRSRQPRERANVFISKEKAVESLRLIPRLERDSAETLREMSIQSVALNVSLFDLLRMMDQPGHSAAVPLIDKAQPQPGMGANRTVSYITGTAVIKDGKMAGVIGMRTTRGLMWLRQGIENAILTFSPEGAKGSLSLRLIRHRSRLVPSFSKGSWSVDIYIRTETSLLQNTVGGRITEEQWIKKAEKGAELAIRERVEAALEESQRKYQADILGFSELFRQRYPRQLKGVEARWNDVFKDINVNVRVQTEIKRLGISDSTVPY